MIDEDDEPIEDVLAAFDAGEQGVTVEPPATACFFCEGDHPAITGPPWLPDGATMLDVAHRHDAPLVGVFRWGDHHYLFRAEGEILNGPGKWTYRVLPPELSGRAQSQSPAKREAALTEAEGLEPTWTVESDGEEIRKVGIGVRSNHEFAAIMIEHDDILCGAKLFREAGQANGDRRVIHQILEQRANDKPGADLIGARFTDCRVEQRVKRTEDLMARAREVRREATARSRCAHCEADRILQTVWGESGDTVDPVAIAHRLGCITKFGPLPEPAVAVLMKNDGDDPRLTIQESMSRPRKRWATAQLLGHLTLHADEDEFTHVLSRTDPSGGSGTPMEVYAHEFATHLLARRDVVAGMRGAGQANVEMAYRLGIPLEYVPA